MLQLACISRKLCLIIALQWLSKTVEKKVFFKFKRPLVADTFKRKMYSWERKVI